jgi:beta-lactam-binding protein with PASTA domain
MPVDTFSNARCVVPKLTGLTLRRATQKLEKQGCARGRISYVKSAKVKKGRIVRQSAKAGKKLKLGGKVRLVVSRGPK